MTSRARSAKRTAKRLAGKVVAGVRSGTNVGEIDMWRYGKMILAAAMIALCGCAAPNVKPTTPLISQAVTASNIAAVCVGVTSVNPNWYDGWTGECPGCDVDATGIDALCRSLDVQSTLLLNADATWGKVKQAVLRAAAPLGRGDLLLIAMSGHGGQIADDNEDEADGLDETVCLWDGQVRDDRVLDLLRQFPTGLRVVLINDQCHSEGNFRAMGRIMQRAVSFGAWGKVTASPLVQVKEPWSIELIQFAGCREAAYSYGSTEGGTWTQSLLATYRHGITWSQWFDAARNKMPAGQVPVWTVMGKVSFADQPAMK